MPVSILHISDLHRDLSDEITNDALVESVLRDREHYAREEPSIAAPDLIIVSGDLVRGVAPTSPDAETRLAAQYEQALHFLARLAELFLGGDHQRVVIVPGNHDVSYYHTVQSLEKLTVDPATSASSLAN
jgi:3',5'-cyclic AMP phosphodiesterase CpdA